MDMSVEKSVEKTNSQFSTYLGSSTGRFRISTRSGAFIVDLKWDVNQNDSQLTGHAPSV